MSRPCSAFTQELLDRIGAPQRTTKLVLTIEINKPIVAEVEYLVDPLDPKEPTRTQKFKLVALDESEAA